MYRGYVNVRSHLIRIAVKVGRTFLQPMDRYYFSAGHMDPATLMCMAVKQLCR